MILISITSMLWWRKNIIVILLSMELMLSSLFSLMSMMHSNIPITTFLVMLTIMVSGSSLGLVMMVSLCRFFKSSNTLPIWSLN